MEDQEDHEETRRVQRVSHFNYVLISLFSNGTSMVTLVIPPKEKIEQSLAFLNNEYSQAANIKSKQTMNSVQNAITSTREKLKLYKQTPKNGLIVFCGQILMDDNKTEKKLTLDIEPFRPAQNFLYRCENRFHSSCL